jgi:predicted enzyme related to lactoylglutathione lyase
VAPEQAADRTARGWDLRRTTRPGKPDAVISCKRELVGGLVEVEPVAGQEVSQWIAYTSVADVDAAVLYRALSRREQCAEGELGQQ